MGIERTPFLLGEPSFAVRSPVLHHRRRSASPLDAAATTVERFSEHLRAASGALGQSRMGLLRRAVRAVELSWNLQVRSCKPDPLGADIVHVREDRCSRAGLAGRFNTGYPQFDKVLRAYPKTMFIGHGDRFGRTSAPMFRQIAVILPGRSSRVVLQTSGWRNSRISTRICQPIPGTTPCRATRLLRATSSCGTNASCCSAVIAVAQMGTARAF